MDVFDIEDRLRKILNVLGPITSLAMPGVQRLYFMLDVFSACGGVRTGKGLPALTAHFPVLAYLGKGWIVRNTSYHHEQTALVVG